MTGFEFLSNVDWSVIVAIVGITEWVKSFSLKFKNLNKFLPLFLCFLYSLFQFETFGGFLKDWFVLWGLVSLFYEIVIKLMLNVVKKLSPLSSKSKNPGNLE